MKENVKELMGVLKLFEKSDFDINDYMLRNMKDKLLELFVEKHDNKKLIPKTQKRHIGIEIECFSSLAYEDIFLTAVSMNLMNILHIGEDASLQSDNYDDNPYEFRILTTEKTYIKDLKKINKFLKRINASTNDTCGLHVHLDMRNRNADACFQKLLGCQNFLFGLVDDSRINNDYCTKTTEIDDSYGTRGAINYNSAYSRHKTIEIRLHHGTCKTSTIENWISLLLKIVNNKKQKLNLSSVVDSKVLKLNKKLMSYVKRTFREVENDTIIGW